MRSYLLFSSLFSLLASSGGIDFQDDGLVNWATDCDFQGLQDWYSLPSKGWECGPGCAATRGCSAFTWTDFNGGMCWLKKGSISTNQAMEKSGALCGVVKQFSGTSGITTRYWDCCKPSCSSNGNASVSNPVATCQQDGTSRVMDVNAQNACGGGPAFTCTNQQPWKSSNENLAYGFAAVALVGTTETQTCCQCYTLQFTNGKIMIVQATNTGNDLQQNQFDIQTPGGGVGQFNGCQRQWGTGPDGWGQRYGGVGQRQECNSLPQQLQGGCFWRFDWLGHNPTMNFKQVQCPQVLTDITGCVRN